MTHFSWRKSFWTNSYQLFSGVKPIGVLDQNNWSNSARGMINGKQYEFRCKGFFDQRIQIIDLATYKTIGTITYNSLRTKATILLEDELYEMKYTNAWNTKWMLYNHKGVRIDYQSATTNGYMTSKVDNDVLHLTGLYVTNYYWQASVIMMVAVMFPMFIALFS